MIKEKNFIHVKKISLIIYDFDGVMTDNRALLFEDGREAVFVNRSDGLAISFIKNLGIRQLIISAETNSVVKARAVKLGIPFIQSVRNKKRTVSEYLKANSIPKEKVVFIGNDMNDHEVMKFVGYPVAPADANRKIKIAAKIVLSAKGGYGVVREFLDMLRGY